MKTKVFTNSNKEFVIANISEPVTPTYTVDLVAYINKDNIPPYISKKYHVFSDNDLYGYMLETVDPNTSLSEAVSVYGTFTIAIIDSVEYISVELKSSEFGLLTPNVTRKSLNNDDIIYDNETRTFYKYNTNGLSIKQIINSPTEIIPTYEIGCFVYTDKSYIPMIRNNTYYGCWNNEFIQFNPDGSSTATNLLNGTIPSNISVGNFVLLDTYKYIEVVMTESSYGLRSASLRYTPLKANDIIFDRLNNKYYRCVNITKLEKIRL